MLSYFLVFFALTFAAIHDLQTRIVPNWCVLVIVYAAVINPNRQPISHAIFSMMAIWIIFSLPEYILKKYVIGGGDLKISAAFAFFIGFFPAIVGMGVAYILAAIVQSVIYLISRDEYFPLVPYLAIGFIFSVIFQ